MPELVRQDADPLARLGRTERDWELQRVRAFDGLAPTQLVRVYREPAGLDMAEGALADRFDHNPDADTRLRYEATEALGRYVVNPFTKKHQFPGLWTGGPVEYGRDQATQRVQLEQTLTRTWCAGHGYTLQNGRFAVSDAPDSLEYATVEAALKAHRPELKRIFNSRMAFRTDIPGSFRTEIRWRDFTHESWGHVETDEGRAAAARAAQFHFGGSVGAVSEVHCELDRDTNTVVILAAALYKATNSPVAAADLLSMPCVEGPCERETLRAAGWGQLADGEGYRYTHRYTWSDISDTAAVRAFLEFGVRDKDVLPGLLAREWAADGGSAAIRLREGEDSGNGRFYVALPDGRRRAWWRILDQKIETADDGLLSFSLVVGRPEWFGQAAGRIDAAVENPHGHGHAKRTVIPSLDREDAERTMAQAQDAADEGFIVAAASLDEGDAGRSDVTLRQERVYAYTERQLGDGGAVVRQEDFPEGVASLGGLHAPTMETRTTASGRSLRRVEYYNVKSAALDDLVARATAAVSSGLSAAAVRCLAQQTGPGAYTLAVSAEEQNESANRSQGGSLKGQVGPYTLTKLEERRVRQSDGTMLDQTRETKITATDYYGAFDPNGENKPSGGYEQDKIAHYLDGAMEGSFYRPVTLRDAGSGPGYFVHKVSSIVPGAWTPQAT